jgi:pimeloyl-ACP methyl ester carboxylesterase
MWEPQVEEFSRYFRVIRLDLRGYGRSDLPSTSGFRYTEDLCGLLGYLGEPKAHLLGLSLGGNVALDFAVNFPEHTAVLVLATPSLRCFAVLPEAAALLSAVPERAKEAGIEAAKALWLAHPYFAPALENPAAAPLLRQMAADYSGWHWVSGNPPSGPIDKVAERLGEVRAPTLVIVGEHDVAQHQRIADHLVTQIPGAQKITIVGAGHMVNLEKPQTFEQVVLDFLARGGSLQ